MLLISKPPWKHRVWQNANYFFLGLENKFGHGKEFISGLSQIFFIIFFFFHFGNDALLLQSVKIFIQEWLYPRHYLMEQLVPLFLLTLNCWEVHNSHRSLTCFCYKQRKVWMNYINYLAHSLLFYLILTFLAALRGMWDLSSPTRDRTHTPCIGS